MRFSVLVPDATTNYITNPSLRYDTTGWNANGATVTRTLEQARFGLAGLKVVTNGASNNEGTFFRVSALSGISESITVSAYVRGTGRVRIRLDNNVVGGAEYFSQPVTLRADMWTRIWVTGFSTGGNDMRLYVETDEGTPRARTFYVDGAQMERKPYPTTYCDGNQEDCTWNGVYHNSTSRRPADTRAGGRWVQLAGEEREAQDLYMTAVGGLGMARVANTFHPFTLAGGGYFQGNKTEQRLISLVFHAMHRAEEDQPVSLAALHALRDQLAGVLGHEVTPGDQPIWFEYCDGDQPLYFQAYYDGGLEGDWDIRNQFINSFPLRLLAVSPLFLADSQDAQVLDFQDQAFISRVVGKVNGDWNNMNYGCNGSIGDLELGARGELVAAGVGNNWNFSFSAVSPFTISWHVSYFDGVKWVSISSFSNGTTINDTAIAPNGDIYVGGNFTSFGGVAANRIARWDGSSWSALGTGLDNDCIHISIASNGDVYAAGKFTTAGGVSAARIARWDGSSWHAMGQYSGFNSDVNSIAITPRGDILYCGGNFTDQLGFAGGMLHVAKYDPTTDRFTQVGQGFDNSVREVILDEAGVLYACGDFTASGATVINYIGKYQGEAWVPLGIGMNGVVNSFDVGRNGDIVAVGSFTTADGNPTRNIAIWNGTTWTNLDIELSVGDSTLTMLAVQYAPNGDLYLAGFWTTIYPNLFSAVNIVKNRGTTEARPVVHVVGPGRMRWLENQTNKKRIFLNLLLKDGEEIDFDFENGTITSNQRGEIPSAVLPGSDFQEFSLLPGDNRISCLMVEDVNAQVQIRYRPTYWSMDATGGLT